MNGDVGKAWKRPEAAQRAFAGFVDVRRELERGLAANPELRLFLASGVYDLATTFFAAEYDVNHLRPGRDRVTLRVYDAGHMMYVHEDSFARLAADLVAFVSAGARAERALPAANGGR
jgi:carboxypeptidase C (cathepsin A)